MRESVEEFLARGGQIERIPRGVSGQAGKPLNRHIVINGRRLDPSDPKSAGKAANHRIFNK